MNDQVIHQLLAARRVGVQGWAEALRSKSVHASVTGNLRAIRLEICRLIERGQASGEIRRDIDADGVARTLIALFQGLILQVTWGEPVDLLAVGPVIQEMLSSLYTPKGRRALISATKN